VGIFSPSEPVTSERQKRMQPSLDLLTRNFEPRFATHALEQLYYQAGSREQRLGDFRELLEDQSVDWLLGSWGGKSANQMVRGLPYDQTANARKPIVGFSDVCVLLNAITAETGLITFCGPNIAGKLHESDHWDFDLLRGEQVPPFGHTAAECFETVRGGRAEGVLFGGNLTTFVLGLAGSRWMSAMDEVVFFWESGSEPPQILDQHLTCLENCGFMDRVVAMIVGDATYDEAAAYKDRPLDDLLRNVGELFDIPVARIPNFGHHQLENPAIPIGARVAVDTDQHTVSLLGDVVQ
jgi:muramoyltetrapeptide carboxypeptidase